MAIVIPNNKLVKPAHEFDSKPGVAKVAIMDAGPVAISATGFHESGAALFEQCDGSNNEGYIGVSLIPTSVGGGIAALKNTIMGNFTGVVPGKAVYLGQNGTLTQDTATVSKPSSGPTLTQSTGSGVLAAGTYKVAFSYVDAAGETLTSPTTSVTIVASKQIDVTAVTPLPTGATAVRWYMSITPDSDTLRRVAQNSGAAFSINALPAGNAASPLTSVAVAGSRRVGVGFTPHLIAFD